MAYLTHLPLRQGFEMWEKAAEKKPRKKAAEKKPRKKSRGKKSRGKKAAEKKPRKKAAPHPASLHKGASNIKKF
jgi:hypothetical protein